QYRQFLVIPHPGPQVAGITALTGTFGKTLTGLTVTFNGPVDPTTFSPADVRSVTDPSGNAVAVQYVFDATLAAPAGTGNAHNVNQVFSPPPQTPPGTYSVLLGPTTPDAPGNPMTQSFPASVAFTGISPPPLFQVPNRQFAHNTNTKPQLTIDLANQPVGP